MGEELDSLGSDSGLAIYQFQQFTSFLHLGSYEMMGVRVILLSEASYMV